MTYLLKTQQSKPSRQVGHSKERCPKKMEPSRHIKSQPSLGCNPVVITALKQERRVQQLGIAYLLSCHSQVRAEEIALSVTSRLGFQRSGTLPQNSHFFTSEMNSPESKEHTSLPLRYLVLMVRRKNIFRMSVLPKAMPSSYSVHFKIKFQIL